MILFYYILLWLPGSPSIIFQFHYDLILLSPSRPWLVLIFLFQFHYDLILFNNTNSFKTFNVIFQFHYDLILLINTFTWFCIWIRISISLWSYSIFFTIPIEIIMYIYFNFIMILFYSEQTTHDTIMLDIFQFHYDLILFASFFFISCSTHTLFQFHYDLILLGNFFSLFSL